MIANYLADDVDLRINDVPSIEGGVDGQIASIPVHSNAVSEHRLEELVS